MADVRLPLAATLTLLAGCLGDVPTGGNTGGGTDAGSGSSDLASAAFASMITPIVTSATHNCADATSCHGGLQPPKLTSFAEFKASGIPMGRYLTKPGMTNIMITKAMTLNGMPHPLGNSLAKPYLSADELTTFQTFIDTYGM
ncbi:MAG TPA: hypothetical protein VGM90_34190 [Kofleriaceae bacterium]|jgi:hypothetical protein